jgi:hypothetical protein
MSGSFGTTFKRICRRCVFWQDLRRRSMTPTPTLLAPRGGRCRSSPLEKLAAADPISAVLPVTVPRPSANRELVARPLRTPSVHDRTARPRVG